MSTFNPSLNPSDSAATIHEVPPSTRYGWVVVCGVFIINAHTWGLNAAYSVFLSSYMDGDAFPGTSATSFAFIGGLSISQAFLVAPLISKFAPRLGTRPLLAFGVLLEGSSFIAASFAEDIWQLFLSQGICFGWGMGLLYTGTVGILPQWFDKRSGLANALASAGSGFGGLAYALAAERLIQQLGIPWTMRILGIICFAANGIATCLVRDRISRDGVKSSLVDIAMLRNLSLDRRLLFGVFSILAYVVCLFSLPTFASSIGLSNQQGSLSAALLSLGQAIGRPLVGLACDKIGTERAGVIASLISALLTLCLWTNTASYAALLAFSMLVGTTAGTIFAIVAPLLADVTDPQNLSSALSLMWLALVVPATFAQPIALWIVDSNEGKFLGAQIFVGIMYLAAALCLLPFSLLKKLWTVLRRMGK